MKRHTWILVTVMALAAAVAGCGKKGGVETSQLEQSFQSAEAPVRTSVNKAVAALKNADYAGAMADLQKLASQAKLTPEQQTAVNDVVEQIKKVIAETASKAAEGANQAIGDLQKSLPK